MKLKNIFLLALLTIPLIAYGFQGFDKTGAEIGHFSEVKCSTGMTCTNSVGKFLMLPEGPFTMESGDVLTNAVDDVLSFQSNDESSTIQALGFEAKDAILLLSADESDDSGDDWELKSATGNNFTLSNDTSGSQVAKMTVSTAGLVTLAGGLLGDGGDDIVGFKQNQIASTSTSLTIAECGATIVSDSADVIVLPEASTALGCRYTFVCGTVDDFDINPADGTDVIGIIGSITGTNTTTVLAPSAGDAIRCTDVGASITLEAVGANLWASIGTANGIWTDVD